MARERAKDQDVAAFSAPIWFVDRAKAAAAAAGLTFSGFLRFCVAVEIGYSRETALILAQHPNLARFAIRQDGAYNITSHAPSLNEPPINSDHLDQLAKAAVAAAEELVDQSHPGPQIATAPPSPQIRLPRPGASQVSTPQPTQPTAAPTKPSRSQS